MFSHDNTGLVVGVGERKRRLPHPRPQRAGLCSFDQPSRFGKVPRMCELQVRISTSSEPWPAATSTSKSGRSGSHFPEGREMNAAMGEENGKKMDELFGPCVETVQSQLFAFYPAMSYPAKE